MKIIGHRGAKGLAPENTLQSFRKALEHGVDELELDLRVTKDKVVILSHDPTVSDPAGNSLSIKNYRYSELLEHKPDLATFEQFIGQIGTPVPLIIEIKPGEPVGSIIKLLGSTKLDQAKLSIASFDQRVLRKVHNAFPDMPIIINESWSGTRATWRAKEFGTRRLSMRSWWLWVGFLSPMKRRGWQISAYTINDPAIARKWRKYLYGIITDYPDRFKK